MKTKLLLFISIFAFIFNGFSQQIWKQNTKDFQAQIAENPKKHKTLTLDKKLFLSILKNVSGRTSSKKKSSTILLPVENNTFEAFEILEAPNFSEELALKFPAIKSYIGKSTSSNKVARFSYSKYNGLTAFITTNNNGTVLVKPTNLKANAYVAFNKRDSEPLSPFECDVTEKAHEVLNKNHAKARISSGDGYLRKYRLALATTGEYSNYFLKGSETSDAERKAVVLAALNTTLTRINGIFERDFGVTLELIPTNDRIIHLNASTDPFTTIGPSLPNVVQSHLDAEIGAANYDIGHVLAHRFRNYGIAYVAICFDGFPGKGSAFSSGPNLASDDFYMVFAHELGHQLGTDHVQSSSSCRSTFEWDTAVEPGSGSTIMSYAGICSPSVQSGLDSYFNYVNIRDVIEVTSLRGCGELISTGNNSPTVNAGSNYTIPKSTPFILEGTADDVDNNSNLSYCWEQNDPENPNSSSFPEPDWTRGPLFRSLPPTNVPLRYIPKLEDVISGNLTPTWEVLPSVSRIMNFVLTVRDNAAFGPKTASDEMTVTVDGSSGPFAVTSQNSNITWQVGELRTITWNVANTNQAPVNAGTVAVYLSTDGGYTYPITVATNVPNSGSYDIIVPEVPESTASARLMVKAENNIFYSINASDINIDLSGFSMHFSEIEKDVCKGDEAVFVFNYKTFSGFNETATFGVDNLPGGAIATFDPATAVNNDTEVTLSISGLENSNQGFYEPIIVGNTTSAQRNARIKLNLFEDLSEPALVSPEHNASQIIPNSTLVWETDQNAETYTIELATDPGFSNIIENTTTNENTFTPSQTEFYTSYYWRVKSDNECGASNFSEVFTFKTSCKDPANITITDITHQSATISWTDDFSSDWEIRIIENAPTPIERNIMSSARSYNISVLNSSTDYDVFVRSLCGSDFSSWIGPQKFTTPVSCPAPSDFVVEDITSDAVNLSWISHGSETAWELEYGLEGFAPGTGTKILTTTNPYELEGLDEGVNYEVYLTAVCGPNTGDDDSFIIGPVQFKFPINYCEIGKFYDTGGPQENYGENERLVMDIYSSGENIPVTVAFNAFDLAEGDLMWIFGPDVSREIYSGTDSPGTITSEKGRITVWFVASDSETSAGWDATVICGALSCPMPSGFVADNTTANTVDLSWTSNGSEPQWELEYGEAGFAQGQGTRVLTDTNPHSLTELSADTDYEVYLKAVCGPNTGDNDSPWVGPLDFTTPVSCPGCSNETRPFITIWQTTADHKEITIPTNSDSGPYNYTVDWGDGTVTDQTGNATHEYSTPGEHVVKITGNFPHIHFNGREGSGKIQAITQWGDIRWKSMKEAFEGCSNLEIIATDAPDLSAVKDMSKMFQNATSFNQDINGWDVSKVIDMTGMFEGATSFNQDLGSWKSHAINRRDMFDDSGLDCTNYSLTLFGWTNNTSASDVHLGADGMEYGTDVSDLINELITNRNWVINDHTSSGGKCLPFEIDHELVTGTVTPPNAGSVQVYPNPVKEQLNIVLDSNHGKIQQMVIRMVSGQVLRRKTVSQGDLADEGVLFVDISNLATGLYLLEVQGIGTSSIFRTKFFKQ
ncbi:BspA family leucine-rich repeat surface protein [Fulvivirga sp. M361]|uniref:reprolysin-like metallopeptidase n=1 Tax=Fulvivirga sp. M361 TaxID=2594266 RepID=UPI00117A2CA0|nr:BspA family leucine-rich repeat surface protein [Fulvivirga sp. M361]TRX49047.1 BspA family leucine-rich repeat surface protein [Fulvivirga sp. M361]